MFSDDFPEYIYVLFLYKVIYVKSSEIRSDEDLDPLISPILGEWLNELPTCPLCLERLPVSASGLTAPFSKETILFEKALGKSKTIKWERVFETCMVCLLASGRTKNLPSMRKNSIKINMSEIKEGISEEKKEDTY
jgi:hypothetical protein